MTNTTHTVALTGDGVLDALGIATAAISVIASLCIIACYLLLPKLRKFSFKLVFWLAVSDLGFSFACMLGDPDDGSVRCYTQAYLVSFFTLASVLWTTVIAHTLHISLHHPDKALGMHRRMRLYHAYTWGVAFVLTMLPQSTDSYGSAGSFCWIRGLNRDGIHDLWRFTQFYGPLWLAMIFNTWVYVKAKPVLASIWLRSVGSGSRQRQKRRLPLLMYPAVLLVCWAAGTVNRLQNWFDPGNGVEWLFIAQVVTSNMQGLLHAIVYSQNHNVQKEVRARLCGRGTSASQHPDDHEDAHEEGGHVELLAVRRKSVESAAAALAPAGVLAPARPEEDAPVTRSRRGSIIEEGAEQLADVSHQIRAAYFNSIGLYALMGLESSVPASSFQVLGRPKSGDTSATTAAQARAPAKATVTQTYFTLAKSFVGIGILALPHAFMQAGYVCATIGIIVVGYVTYITMLMLVQCRETVDAHQTAHGGESATFASVGRAAAGSIGSALVEGCLVFSQIGFCTSYIIFIGENLADAISSQAGILESWGRGEYIVLACLFSVPLACLRNLKGLAFGALIADVAILFGLVTIFIFDLQALNSDPPEVAMAKLPSLPMFFGVAVFAFEGIGLVIPVQQSMAEPERFQPVLRNCMIGYTALICVTATISYAAFGDATDSIITLNLPKGVLTMAVQVFYSIGLYLTFPIVLFPATRILETTRCYQRLPKLFGKQLFTSYAFRTFIVALVAMFALLIPHFGLFVNLVGAGACTAIAFVLPAYFHYVLHKESVYTHWKPKAVGVGVVLFGVVGGALSFVLSMVDLVNVIAGGDSGGSE